MTDILIIMCQRTFESRQKKKKQKKKVLFQSLAYLQITSSGTVSWDQKYGQDVLEDCRYFLGDRRGRKLSTN